MKKQKIIQQGAEAIIYLDKKKIIKERTKKSYRITELDEKLRKARTKKEARTISVHFNFTLKLSFFSSVLFTSGINPNIFLKSIF